MCGNGNVRICTVILSRGVPCIGAREARALPLKTQGGGNTGVPTTFEVPANAFTLYTYFANGYWSAIIKTSKTIKRIY